MELIRSVDIDIIHNKVDGIIKESELEIKNKIEPKIDEFKNIQNIIIEYIQKKKRIVYGGYAINKYITTKNKQDAIYDSNHYADIEFYGYKPVKDIINLCKI